uniref:Probable endonuclease 4 n=1 Tax=Thermosporothrix sp. COM3 TaxID=2490863 RepID=A0A455SV59_9CHLR|nr:putative endonuclease 4 [Thermosporothrix sp. COM3]
MRIGRHMPTNSKPVQAAEIAHRIGCNAIQIFASNPTGWKPPALDPEGSQAFAAATRMLDLDPVVLHAPYLINLGSSDATNREKSISLLSWTLQRGELLGAKYVVFHTGSHRGAGVEAGLRLIADGITAVMEQTPESVMLLLENDVGAGHSIGSRFENLAAILEMLPQYQQRLGVCLDTAHLWGAGFDIGTPEGSTRVLQHFQETVGLHRLKVLHLNDTLKALGSHRDVHARLGEGIIGEAGLRTLLTDPRLAHVAVLMETPIKKDEHEKEDWTHDATQIAKAKSLCLPLSV